MPSGGLKAHHIFSTLHWNVISMFPLHPIFMVLFKFYIRKTCKLRITQSSEDVNTSGVTGHVS